MTTPALILFDIDGTLVRARGAGRRSFTLAFARVFGVDDAFDGVSFSGRTDLDLLHTASESFLGRMAVEAEIDAFFQRYVATLEADMATGGQVEVLPAVFELLDSLSARPNTALGLATGNAHEGARIKLAHGEGLDRYFAFGGFGSDARQRIDLTRLAMERGLARLGTTREETRVVVVGDSVYDVRCAKGIGAVSVAVCTGWDEVDMLAAERPDFLEADLRGWRVWGANLGLWRED